MSQTEPPIGHTKVTDEILRVIDEADSNRYKVALRLTKWVEAHQNKAVKAALAKHVLAGMPELTPRQQDYITRVLANNTGNNYKDFKENLNDALGGKS